MTESPFAQTIKSSIVADSTGYVSAATLTERGQRQEARLKLRSALRQVTNIRRLHFCGLPFDGDLVVRCLNGVHHFAGMRRQKEDTRRFSGVSTCGSAWICPVCSSKIRHQRAGEVSRAIVAALDQRLSALFVTVTIPHSAADRLGVTLNLLAEGRRYTANQPAVKALRREMEYVGSITAKEISYGESGWHPHTHSIELFKQEPTLAEFANVSAVYYHYLHKFYCRHGFDGLSRQHGVRIETVELHDGALANYLTKLKTGTDFRLHTAHEVTRWDLKQGRGSIMPFDIAALYFETGKWELLALWREYEDAVSGKSSVRFTEGLRARLLPYEAERSDQRLSELAVGGVTVVRFTSSFYRTIAQVPGLEGKVLTALDTGGYPALVELLKAYQLDDQDGYWQLEGEGRNGAA